jgi:hypothetical protein
LRASLQEPQQVREGSAATAGSVVSGPSRPTDRTVQDLDLGPPIAYVLLEEGTPVYEHGGTRIGVVEELLGDLSADVFDGILIHTTPLPGRHVVATADQIEELRRRGVILAVDPAALEPAREPSRAAAARSGGGDRPAEPSLHRWARRTWDRLTGAR